MGNAGRLAGRMAVTVLYASVVMGGCAIDFGASVPCETDGECPRGETCDTRIKRCTAQPIVEQDVTEEPDVSEDPDVVLPDVDEPDAPDEPSPVDDVDPGEDAEPSDSGEGDAQDSGTDTGSCTPTLEWCDGRDNDCDGLPDDGLTCIDGCPEGMKRIVLGQTQAFCIDVYEASRRDATAFNSGTDNSIATNRKAVYPFDGASFEMASDACEAAGKRLCETAEWLRACKGQGSRAFPYGANFRSGICMGVGSLDRTSTVPTGSLPDCVSTEGVFDMSGNVAEWTADRKTRGGSYNSPSPQLMRCDGEEVPDPASMARPNGFRCCLPALVDPTRPPEEG